MQYYRLPQERELVPLIMASSTTVPSRSIEHPFAAHWVFLAHSGNDIFDLGVERGIVHSVVPTGRDRRRFLFDESCYFTLGS